METGWRAEAGTSSGGNRSGNHVSFTEQEGMEGDDDLGAYEDAPASDFVPGPLVPLKEQLERDKFLDSIHTTKYKAKNQRRSKIFSHFWAWWHTYHETDDESLRRWKEQLLGCIEGELDGQVEPEVTFHSIAIVAEGCAEIITPLPLKENQTRILFTLKEGSQYCLKLAFSVKHNIVSGLTYSNTVWKGGLQVDQIQGMLGTFAPQPEPYTHMLDEDTTPSGALARGMYSAKLKFEDDDKRCHLELDYSFEIKRC